MMLPETTEQLAALQRKDPTWRKVMENIEMFAQFTMRQGVLFHEEARCLPQDKEFMAKVLHDAHDRNGHMGISKSYDVMSKQWYRPGMLNILTAYVNSCVICKGAKKSRQRPSGRMHPQRNLTALAFDNIALDIFSLPLSDGYDACLTIMDTSTKMVILQPTRSTASTEDVAEMLFTSVICKGFLPSTIISDRDPKYTSDLWAAVMKKLGTKIQLTTPYHWHQQADPAERTIQTVKSVLRCYNGVDWVKRLPYVELALNEGKNDSTGFAPHDLRGDDGLQCLVDGGGGCTGGDGGSEWSGSGRGRGLGSQLGVGGRCRVGVPNRGGASARASVVRTRGHLGDNRGNLVEGKILEFVVAV
jgi:hypothetical protein